MTIGNFKIQGKLFLFQSILSSDMFSQGEPRVLGLAMIPGHHVVSIEVEADSLEDTQGFRPRY